MTDIVVNPKLVLEQFQIVIKKVAAEIEESHQVNPELVQSFSRIADNYTYLLEMCANWAEPSDDEEDDDEDTEDEDEGGDLN